MHPFSEEETGDCWSTLLHNLWQPQVPLWLLIDQAQFPRPWKHPWPSSRTPRHRSPSCSTCFGLLEAAKQRWTIILGQRIINLHASVLYIHRIRPITHSDDNAVDSAHGVRRQKWHRQPEVFCHLQHLSRTVTRISTQNIYTRYTHVCLSRQRRSQGWKSLTSSCVCMKFVYFRWRWEIPPPQ